MTVLSDDELINLYIANCGNESGYKDVAKSFRAVADAAVAHKLALISTDKLPVELTDDEIANALGWLSADLMNIHSTHDSDIYDDVRSANKLYLEKLIKHLKGNEHG